MFAMLAVFTVVIIGVSGIKYLEQLSWGDAAYFVVITLATVGYGDIVPKTIAGRIFTVGLVGVGLVIMGYALSVLTTLQIKQVWGIARMKTKIANLENHIIVCGVGRVGTVVVDRLKNAKQAFVVIENHEETINNMREEGVLTIQGDATLDETLIEAGIHRAAGIITALSADADNVYVTLTARTLNSHIKIVSRANRQEAEEKLKRAGAHSVIYPALMGARQMVSSMLQPVIVDFMENVVYNKELHLDIGEIQLYPGSALVGVALSQSGIKSKFDAIIIAVKRGEAFIHNPNAAEILCANDILIVLGHRQQLLELAEAGK
jgi:voltage-gated potassium channel